jgi:hypothetical protein
MLMALHILLRHMLDLSTAYVGKSRRSASVPGERITAAAA